MRACSIDIKTRRPDTDPEYAEDAAADTATVNGFDREIRDNTAHAALLKITQHDECEFMFIQTYPAGVTALVAHLRQLQTDFTDIVPEITIFVGLIGTSSSPSLNKEVIDVLREFGVEVGGGGRSKTLPFVAVVGHLNLTLTLVPPSRVASGVGAWNSSSASAWKIAACIGLSNDVIKSVDLLRITDNDVSSDEACVRNILSFDKLPHTRHVCLAALKAQPWCGRDCQNNSYIRVSEHTYLRAKDRGFNLVRLDTSDCSLHDPQSFDLLRDHEFWDELASYLEHVGNRTSSSIVLGVTAGVAKARRTSSAEPLGQLKHMGVDVDFLSHGGKLAFAWRLGHPRDSAIRRGLPGDKDVFLGVLADMQTSIATHVDDEQSFTDYLAREP